MTVFKEKLLEQELRPDGRTLNQIRELSSEIDVLAPKILISLLNKLLLIFLNNSLTQ
jgi:polyribonucleotide nucleotidyltransferase